MRFYVVRNKIYNAVRDNGHVVLCRFFMVYFFVPIKIAILAYVIHAQGEFQLELIPLIKKAGVSFKKNHVTQWTTGQ